MWQSRSLQYLKCKECKDIKNASNSVTLEQILSIPHHGTFFLPRMSGTVVVGFCFSLPLGKLVICGDYLLWQYVTCWDFCITLLMFNGFGFFCCGFGAIFVWMCLVLMLCFFPLDSSFVSLNFQVFLFDYQCQIIFLSKAYLY